MAQLVDSYRFKDRFRPVYGPKRKGCIFRLYQFVYIGHDWNPTEKIFLITFGSSIEKRSTSALGFRMHLQQQQGKIIMEL